MTGDAGARRRRAWALYDFANSAFTTVVVTFLYGTWFMSAMAPDPVTGTGRWSWAVTGSALAVAVLAPWLGHVTDATATRRLALRWLTAGCVAATALLAFVAPPHWLAALIVFGVANVSYELGQAVYNAFLPSVATPSTMGRTSGDGWALGYAGGLGALIVCLLFSGVPGLLEPLATTRDGWNVRATCLVVALWFALFSLPALRCLAEPPPAPSARGPFRRLAETARDLARYPQAGRLLLARLVYNDGLITIFAFGGQYAQAAFGFTFGEIVLLGIWLNVTAGLGAFLFGRLDDRRGGKAVVAASLVGLCAATALAALARGPGAFWVAATAIGLLVGPNQASSRSLLARFVPQQRCAEFFGLFAFSGKATAFLGPLLFGRATEWFGSHRAGIATLLVFFGVGLVLLMRVDEAAGLRRARSG